VLLEAADSPQCCRRFGLAGRQRVEEVFSSERTLAAYESLWAGILGFHAPATACG
jgi:hypothetical protein